MIKYYKRIGNNRAIYYLMENTTTDELYWRESGHGDKWVKQSIGAREFITMRDYKKYHPITEGDLMLELL